MHNLEWSDWVWQLRISNLSCLPQDCSFPFFPLHFSCRPSKAFLLLFAKLKNKQTDKQGRNVQMLPTLAPRPVLNCEGSGKDKTCGEKKEKGKKGSGLWCGFSQTICQSAGVRTLAKCGQGNIFHSISSLFNKKKNEKMKHSVKSCFIPFSLSGLIRLPWNDEIYFKDVFFSLDLNVLN